MSANEPVVPSQMQSTRRPGLRDNKRRRRLLITIGCLPVTIITALALILVLNFVFFFQAPTWIPDKTSYLVAGRLLLSLGTLASMQMLVTWGIGLMAAFMGLRAAAGQGGLLIRRLAVIRRRLEIGTWAVVALRLVVVLILVASAAYLFTSLLGFHLAWDFADSFSLFVSRYPALFGLAASICLAQWLIGPFLRLRYSLALGALAGAWTRDRDYRPWLALSLRLGMGLAGLLALIWGITIVRLTVGIIFDPVGYPSLPQYPDLFPLLPPGAASAAMLTLQVAGLVLLHSVIQVILTQVALNSARARLARPKRLTFYAATAQSFRELAKADVPQSGADLKGQPAD